MSFAEQVGVYEAVALAAPNQNRYDLRALQAALNDCSTVTEIGGWQGHLAADVLRRHSLARWLNYEICRWATTHTVCVDPAYQAITLSDWPWNTDLAAADLFVASHVIEHMRFAELERLADQFEKFDRLHLQIPVSMLEQADWTGYRGSHILEVPWTAIDQLLGEHGLFTADDGECRTYQR